MKMYFSKIILFCLAFWAGIFLWAQPVANYYNAAEGKTGNSLRVALCEIIGNHTVISYGGLWSLYATSDTMHVENQVFIYDTYSVRADRSASYRYAVGTNQCGNYSGEGDCYNREHSVPKSWFNDASPMYSDAFHLYPTDGYVNGRRGNDPYGEVGSVTWTSTNGSKLGTARSGLGVSGTVFEPIDAYKGDFARSYFYMATRYQSQCSNWGGGMFGSQNNGFTTWAINMLLVWHRNDPVSQKEINRNNAIAAAQHNRNPFIDCPELAEYIWGNKTNEAWNGTSGISENKIVFSLVQTVVKEKLTINAIETNLYFQIVNFNGQIAQQGELHENQIVIENLPNGIYLLVLQKDGKKSVEKFVKICNR